MGSKKKYYWAQGYDGRIVVRSTYEAVQRAKVGGEIFSIRALSAAEAQNILDQKNTDCEISRGIPLGFAYENGTV